jgi:hypothetical protein
MAENSPIRAKGVGKSAVRHDLDGTPGLHDSDLQQGEVSEFEQGQKQVQNTQAQQALSQAAPQGEAPRAALPGQPMAVPDAVTFAGQKVGGNLAGAGTAIQNQKISFSNWLPLLRRLAVSPTSSGILQRAFVTRMSQEIQRPTGGKASLIRQRDFDQRLEQFVNGG